MNHQTQNQQQPHPSYTHMHARQTPSSVFLPEYWTLTDQVIMEDLLLSHDVSTPPLTMSMSPSSASRRVATTARGDAVTSRDPFTPPAALLMRVDATSTSAADAASELQRWSKRSGSAMSSPSSCSGSSTPSTTAPSGLPSQAAAAAPPPPPTQSRSAKVSDEERRARHRAVQKRFVQRKKEAIKQIKQHAAELEKQYALLQIATESRHLADENDALQAQCAATKACTAAATVATPDPLAQFHKQIELVREFYAPLTHAEWTAVLQRNLDEYDVASRDRSYLTSGLTVMGWHDQRKIDDSSVKFVLSKEFMNVRAVALMEKTWQQLSSPETHAQFFSPVFTVRVQVLQVLNENARVLHRAIYNPQTGGIVHGLDLLCRVQRGCEFIIFESAIEHNAVHACLGASHRWSHVTVSHVFAPSVAPSGVESCVFRHGGILRHFAVASVKYWLMEMFFIALRYESNMVAPIFSLAAE